jgi:hypothetical protein
VDLCEVSEDRSAAHLTNVIQKSLSECAGVDKSVTIIGQSYDGASNMAGIHNSVSQRMKMKWPVAHFTHCYSHKLALVARQACLGIKRVSLFLVLSKRSPLSFGHLQSELLFLLIACLETPTPDGCPGVKVLLRLIHIMMISSLHSKI